MIDKFCKYLLILAFCPLFNACEKVTEEIPSVGAETDPTGSAKVFYTLQEQDLVIEPAQFISLQNAKSLKVTSKTSFGSASFTDEGVLLYSPSEGVVEADEQVAIQLLKNDGKIISENLLVKILPRDSKMPCFLGAMSDKIRVEMNKRVVADVLLNDQFCEGRFLGISISSNPKNGKAELESGKLVYTPNQGFKGTDRLFYKVQIEKTNGQTVSRVASVTIDVYENKPTCQTRLVADNIVLKPQSGRDSFTLNVMLNDIICPEDLAAPFQLEVTSKPALGIVQVLPNKLIRFKFAVPPMVIAQTVRDSFFYQIVAKSGTYTSKVVLMNPKPGSDCNPVAIYDEFVFSLKDLQSKSLVEIDLLRNDFLCSGNVKISKLIPLGPVVYNLSVNSANLVKYTPAGGKFVREEVQFKYEITDDKGKKALALVKIKFVD